MVTIDKCTFFGGSEVKTTDALETLAEAALKNASAIKAIAEAITKSASGTGLVINAPVHNQPAQVWRGEGFYPAPATNDTENDDVEG